MLNDDVAFRAWLCRLVDGDEEVVADFWRCFGTRLQQLAAQHLSLRVRRRIDPEDVVQSVCRTFFRRLQAGQFELAGSEQLWRLLCAITLTKTREQTRFHLRGKRGLEREREPIASSDESQLVHPEALDREPTPAEAAEFAELLGRLLSVLSAEEQQALQLKLEQYTHQEIAERMRCSERTVRRLLNDVKARLKQLLEESW